MLIEPASLNFGGVYYNYGSQRIPNINGPGTTNGGSETFFFGKKSGGCDIIHLFFFMFV